MSPDVYLTHLINAAAGTMGPLDWVMRFLAQIAIFFVVLGVAVRWFWPGDRAYERHVAVSCGLASALGLIANLVIQLFYERPRPFVPNVTHLIVPPINDAGFPSDHTTLAFAVAAMLLIKRHPLAPWFTAAAALIAFSRVYVGVHYVGDVLGGCAVGFLAAYAVSLAYRRDSTLDRKLVSIL